MNIKKNQKGFSLLELLVVFAVVAVLVAVVYRTVTAVDEGKVAKVVNDDYRLLDRIIVQTRGPNAYSLTGITVAEVIATDKSGKLSRDTTGDGNNDKMYVGANYEVTDVSPDTIINANDGYAATIGGFSEQNCVNVVQSLWGIADKISVGGTEVKSTPTDIIDATRSGLITTNCTGASTELILSKRISS